MNDLDKALAEALQKRLTQIMQDAATSGVPENVCGAVATGALNLLAAIPAMRATMLAEFKELRVH